jgi:hypothetical protein
MSNTAIADHALLSDRHSCALVDRIAPTGEWRCTRRYVDRTLVLETNSPATRAILRRLARDR